jgi:hypothetical protein
MVTRRPTVVQSGFVAELPVGDTADAGSSTTQVVAGSGLVGGGLVSDNPRIDLALAPNPSGIIYVGDALGLDGVAQVTAEAALASGSAAEVLADSALASGNASLVTATVALASGNAALVLVPTLGGVGTVAEFTAASAVASGYVVGIDDAGKIQAVVSGNPLLNGKNNVLGIAQSTVSSGSLCTVNLPGILYNDPAASLTTGAFYYADPTTSGITTTSTQPTPWDGQVPWNYIGRAVTTSGLMLLKSI